MTTPREPDAFGPLPAPHRPARPLALVAALSALALVAAPACKRRGPPPAEAPLPTVATSSTSPFVVARGGTDPAFRTRDGALWVFVSPGSGEGAERTLAGVGLGDARGPRYGLLSGTFAPLLVAADSTKAYTVSIAATPDGLVATFGPSLAVLIHPPHDGRTSLVVRGDAALLVPADRTEVRATLRGAPALAVQVSSGDAPEVLAPVADRLELSPRGQPALAIDSTCTPRVVRPVPRGSTSVFVVHLGAGRSATTDPLLGVTTEGAVLPRVEPCAGTATSTLSVPWPPTDA